MGKIEQMVISFSNQSKIFHPGQVVAGDVQLQVKEEVKIREIRLQLVGFAKVRWTEEEGSGERRHTVTYSAREDYFNNVIKCQTPPNGEDNMMLQPGSYRFPFAFQLPPNIPSSFEGAHGRVRYYVKATVDRPWAFDDDVTTFYTIINLLDLNTLPEASKPAEASDSKTLCCLCCESGPITGKHRINKLGYVPGEAINIMAECINHSNRDVRMTRMELLQIICYHSTRKTRRVSTILQRTFNKSVPRGDTDVWGGVSIVVPPLPSTGLLGCNIIDIQYFWQYVCEPSGPAFNLRVPIKIIIGSIPLNAAVQQYGQPAPMDFGNSMYPPSSASFPEHTPRPAFASFSTYNTFSDNRQQTNQVQPEDDEMQMSSFQPQYPYYNWNKYDTDFKPMSY